MKKYVYGGQTILEIFKKYKFLEKFISLENGLSIFSSEKINDYYEYQLVDFKQHFNSDVLNKIIYLYYKKLKIKKFLGIK